MNSPSSGGRFVVQLATPDDAADLAAIYRSDDGFDGDIAVQFTRDPDPYASLLAEGDDVVVPVARDLATGQIVGMGACVLRTAWVNGRPARVGYLTGLKALPEFRGWVRLIPQVYAFLREHTAEVECYVTTILSANAMARRMLERERRTMPRYRFVAEYVTHCFRSSRGRERLDGGTVEELARLLAGTAEGSAETLGGTAEGRTTLPADAADGLTGPSGSSATGGHRFNLWPVGAPPSVGDGDVRVLRDPSGTALAWCAVLDQRARKQYRIMRYGGVYERLARLPVHWAGYPRLPRAGAVANHVSVVGMGAVGDDPRLLRRLLRGVGWEFRDRDFVMAGAVTGHPAADALAAMRAVRYESRLYDVTFDERCVQLDARPIALDVAYL